MTNYNNDNVFYQILNNQLPCRKVYESDFVLAFYDINPQAKIHVLIIPKKSYVNYCDFLEHASQDEIVQFNFGLYNTIKVLGINNFKIISNNGPKAGQEVFHFHCHILSEE